MEEGNVNNNVYNINRSVRALYSCHEFHALSHLIFPAKRAGMHAYSQQSEEEFET